LKAPCAPREAETRRRVDAVHLASDRRSGEFEGTRRLRQSQEPRSEHRGLRRVEPRLPRSRPATEAVKAGLDALKQQPNSRAVRQLGKLCEPVAVAEASLVRAGDAPEPKRRRVGPPLALAQQNDNKLDKAATYRATSRQSRAIICASTSAFFAQGATCLPPRTGRRLKPLTAFRENVGVPSRCNGPPPSA
jgi:hypothetical protein